MYGEKHETKTLFVDPKAPEKPIGNEGIRQKASTKCIQRKQGGELCNDCLTLRPDLGSGRRESGRVSDFDCWGEKRVQSSHRQVEPEIAKEHQTVGTQQRNRKLVLKKNWQSGRHRSQCPTAVEKDVVPSQTPRSLDVGN